MTDDKIKKHLSAVSDIDDRYKGTYTALIDYIQSRGITETPENLFALMRHFGADDKNSYTHKINAPIPFIMEAGLSWKTSSILLDRSIKLKEDIQRESGHLLLIDSQRLSAILDLCLSKEPNEKIYLKEINSISKKDKRIISYGYALDHKEMELISDGFLQDETIAPDDGITAEQPTAEIISLTDKPSLGEKERGNLYRIIHAMKDILLDESTKDSEGNQLFISQNKLIEHLADRYNGYGGLKPSNLKQLCAKLNKELSEAEKTFNNS